MFSRGVRKYFALSGPEAQFGENTGKLNKTRGQSMKTDEKQCKSMTLNGHR